MATRKLKNPEGAAETDNLAAAVQHIRQAINNKLEELGAVASAELNKAMLSAQTRRGRAERRFDALWAKAERRLLKASDEAKKSLHKAVRRAEKRLEVTKKTVQATLADLAPAGTVLVASKSAAATKVPTRKALATKAAARKPAAKKPAAKKTVAK